MLLENGTGLEIPMDMQLKDSNRFAITGFSLLILCSAVGNIYVLISIIRRNKGKISRINLLLLHLTIANLLVTFLMMPLEIVWNYTVSWLAGDFMCRLMSFFRAFGHYLTGFVIVVISLDLYFAVVKPFAIAYADRRAKIMLAAAWIASIICSFPQSIEKLECYEQCLPINFFPSEMYKVAYDAFFLFFLHLFPLSMVIFCYSCILYQAIKFRSMWSSKSSNDEITVTIVTAFFICWSPYTICRLGIRRMIDSKSAQSVDGRIQAIMFVCTNSVFNPLIYGLFPECK
ncbi:Gonadotropin-releasing hormone receptor, partial [Orchesella cincta]